MRIEEFKEWLAEIYPETPSTVSNRISNCKKVENYHGDLDKHYEQNGCNALMDELSYSVMDERENKPSKHLVPIDGNMRTGSATLKQAVRLYSQFCEEKGSGLEILWGKYNYFSNEIVKSLERTNNIVGEYAEYLAQKFVGGKLLPPSHGSADVKSLNGLLYQVKSRKIDKIKSTSLGIIRSWKFDFLCVILFDLNGSILIALEVPVEVAKEYAKDNSHQNGWVITTTQKFLLDDRNKNITKML